MSMKTDQDKILTHEDWKRVGSWEDLTKDLELPVRVSEEIYWEFLEVLPPQEYGKTRASFIHLPIPVQKYFLVGEAMSTVNGRPVYACFAMAYDDKYFFLGYLPEEKSLLSSIEAKDEEAIQDWNKRAESGEPMRII